MADRHNIADFKNWQMIRSSRVFRPNYVQYMLILLMLLVLIWEIMNKNNGEALPESFYLGRYVDLIECMYHRMERDNSFPWTEDKE